MYYRYCKTCNADRHITETPKDKDGVRIVEEECITCHTLTERPVVYSMASLWRGGR